MMTQQNEKGVISGKAYWTHLHKHDGFNDRYQVDIGNLSDESVELLESNGVKIKPPVNTKGKKHPSGGPYVVSHTKFQKRNSVSDENPTGLIGITVLDEEKKPFDVMNVRIGNGSDIKVRVKFNKDHPFSAEWGTSLWLDKVQVTNLVSYEEGGDQDSDDDF
jgi:hypothetical protein